MLTDDTRHTTTDDGQPLTTIAHHEHFVKFCFRSITRVCFGLMTKLGVMVAYIKRQLGIATQMSFIKVKVQTDGPTFVRRRHGETLHQHCVPPTVKYGGGGIMMWDAMSFNGTAFLTKVNGNLNGAGYINILENSAIPSAHLLGFGDNFWFQDDSAPSHRTQLVAEWKAENNLRCLCWPPQSPDLNPIENVWWDVKLGLKQLRPRNLQELEDNVC